MPSSNLLCECCVPINGAKSSEMDLLWGKCSEAELSEYIHCLNLYPEPTNDQLLVCRAVGNTTLSFLQKIQTFLICFSCRCTDHTSASGPGPFFFGCLCRELIFSYPSCELIWSFALVEFGFHKRAIDRQIIWAFSQLMCFQHISTTAEKGGK